MVEIGSLISLLIPLTIPGIVTMFVNSLLAFIVVVLSDKVISHNLELKRASIVSGVALFITPVVGALVAGYTALPVSLSGIIFAYVLPLLVWIVLGEILLKSDMKTKLKVMAIAFVAYIVLSFTVAPVLLGVVSGYLPA
ncbi:MAG: hypothetical protein HYU56_04355 [Candidatus Aenigmarchaeota archaeon]|nr:hypothetical protein [Candidatus Aenigmarchaeota archaeon]